MSHEIDPPNSTPKPKRKKTGGRQKGTPNKANIRMRDRLYEAGFDFSTEFLKAWQKQDFAALELLTKLAPYFMQRLREEAEDTSTPAPTPSPNSIPTASLLSIVKNDPSSK